jgi:uncharacterized membrane protein YdjX (TVP38/TMEM64 family)
MPQLLHAFLGLSKVRFWTHFWGSLVGYAIPLLLLSYFGQKLFDLMNNAPVEAWIALGATMVAIAATVWLVRRKRAAKVVGKAGVTMSADATNASD